MDHDTDLGGRAAAFPATDFSLVRAVASPEPTARKEAQEALIAAYWKPVYKYIRVQWRASNEDAKDLTQAFFTRALEKEFFDGFDPAKSRFRTFMRLCVDAFLNNDRRAAAALKRGGNALVLSLDFEVADGELRRQDLSAALDADDYFRQEWIRTLFSLAVEDLRQECAAAGKETHFALFERYDLDGAVAGDGLTYAQLGQELGLSTAQVTNFLAFARSRFRQRVLDRLRAATATDEEYREEAQQLFGGNAP